MSETSKNTGNGIGLGTVLFLIFLTLKLAEIGPVKDWNWWQVTSPLWVPITAILIIMIIAGLVVVVVEQLKK